MTSGSPLQADPVRKGKRTLLMIAAAVIAPVALSYGVYYLSPRGTFTNYGELLPTRPAPAISGTRADGSPFRIAQAQGRWTIVVASAGTCDVACAQQLYATRQARTMQGRERERIERLWLVPDGVSARSQGARRASGRHRRAHDAGGGGGAAEGRGRDLPDRPDRQPGARVAARPGHQGAGARSDPRAESIADRLNGRISVKYAVGRWPPHCSMTVATLSSHRFRQFLALTKPRVVSLIVFVAIIGMFLATPGLPPPGVVFAATLGIALVAGAAAAINCLVEQTNRWADGAHACAAAAPRRDHVGTDARVRVRHRRRGHLAALPVRESR